MTAPRFDARLPTSAVVRLLELAAGDTESAAEVADLLAPLPVSDAAAIQDAWGRLRATTSGLRKRGHELSALFSSARELAQLRDVDALLDRLVQRAGDLIGTDLIYLSEFDPATTQLRVRTTLGAVSARFRQLHVPPGMGLASKVVETKSPQWASRYGELTSIPHEAGIDAAVHAEGLVSLLGVPMLDGNAVLGVLFAANRSEHAFTPGEVALLSALADHASVVLQTARLFDEAQRASDQTRQSYEVLSRHVTAMERASAVHEELTSVVLRGGGAADVADIVARALRRPVAIVDGRWESVASSDATAASWLGPVAGDIESAVDASRRTGRCVTVDTAGQQPCAVVAIVAGDAYLGAVLVGDGQVELGPVELRTVERAAQIAALLTLWQDVWVDAEERFRGELVADIVSAIPARRRDLQVRARAGKIPLSQLRVAVAVVLEPAQHRAARRALWELGPTGEVAGVMVHLSQQEDPRTAAEQTRQCLRRSCDGPVLTVAAAAVDSYEDFVHRFETLERGISLLRALGVNDSAVTSDAYLPYAAVFGADPSRVGEFITQMIGPVRDWDARRGTDLLNTLRSYVDNFGSATRTARALHLHTNTVLQRLDRVSVLLGSDWKEPEPLFRLTLALRLHFLSTDM